jgi:hypothetical protein
MAAMSCPEVSSPAPGKYPKVKKRPPVLKKRNLPFELVAAYVLTTLVIGFLGPWEYADYDKWIVVAFMAAFLFVCFLGYETGVRTKTVVRKWRLPKKFLLRLYAFALYVALGIHCLELGSNIISFGAVSLGAAIANIGSTYSAALAAARQGADVSVIVQAKTLLGASTQYAVIGGMFWFGELKLHHKILLIGLISVVLLNAIMFRGTQKPIGDLVIYFLSVRIIRDRYAKKSRLPQFILATGLVSILVFGYMQLSRLQAYGADISTIAANPALSINEAHPVFTLLGPQAGLAAAVLTGYVSMGYYGLSLSLHQGFVWTYGLGNSFALSSYAEQYLGIPSMLSRTYPFRVQQATSWPALTYWQSIFPWLASDLTFIGTLAIFSVIAFVYAKCWREATEHANMLSVWLFANLNIMWLFVPCNNQLMQTRESTIVMILLGICWVLFHSLLNYPHMPFNTPESWRTHQFVMHREAPNSRLSR